jgi:hypothetical protein
MTKIANVVKREINVYCEYVVCWPSEAIGSASNCDQCQSLHVVVRILPYHRTVGLRRDQPAAGEHRLTGDLAALRAIAMATRSGTTNLLAANIAVCLGLGVLGVPRVDPWTMSSHPGQR